MTPRCAACLAPIADGKYCPTCIAASRRAASVIALRTPRDDSPRIERRLRRLEDALIRAGILEGER